jgi:nucleoside 2-deoxyribosyltransferase
MNQSVFVIMPVSGVKTAPDKLRIVQSIALERSWSAHLPAYDPDAPVFNLNETIREMRASNLIIADLTGERPSCYYELGLAEALHLPIFAVAERNTPIHQTSIRAEVKSYEDLDDFARLMNRALAAQ